MKVKIQTPLSPKLCHKILKMSLGTYFAYCLFFYFSISAILSDDFSGALVTDRSCTQPRKQSFEEHDDGCLDEVNGVSFYPSSKSIRESDSQLIYSTPRRSKRLACTYIHVLCRHSFFFFLCFVFGERGGGWRCSDDVSGFWSNVNKVSNKDGEIRNKQKGMALHCMISLLFLISVFLF